MKNSRNMCRTLAAILLLGLLSLQVSGGVAANSTETVTVVSDTSVMVYGPQWGKAPLGDPAWGDPRPSVLTWHYPYWPMIPGADWIGTSYRTECPWFRWFTKNVELPPNAYNIEGTIWTTADDIVEVYVNGQLIGSHDAWGQIASFDFSVPSDADAVTLDFIVTNLSRGGCNPSGNPTGLIFKSVITYDSGLQATVDIKPDTLNLKSGGKWVTTYIELPDGYDVADIDVGTVMLEGAIPAEDDPTEVGDYDDDSIPDLMVKFDRQALIEYLDGTTGEVMLTVSGELGDGTCFEGSDTVIVINPGKK